MLVNQRSGRRGLGILEIFLPGILVFDVLNGATALDTTNSKSLRVGEAAHDPGLPLEWALEGLVELAWFLEVDDVDVPVRGADDQEIVPDIHRVYALLALQRAHGVAAAE